VPEDQRRDGIAAAGRAGDAASVRALVAVAEGGGPLASDAIGALGGHGLPEARSCVDRLVTHGDPAVARAAVSALGQRGAAGVPDLQRALAANRQRPDGFEEIVCAAGIEALADTQAVAAVAPLGEALAAIQADSVFSYAFAEKVIAALDRLGHVEAVPFLAAHRARLERDRERYADNPLGQSSIDQQIQSTQAVIDRLLHAGGSQP
jgi:HEAT repeat protein